MTPAQTRAPVRWKPCPTVPTSPRPPARSRPKQGQPRSKRPSRPREQIPPHTPQLPDRPNAHQLQRPPELSRQDVQRPVYPGLAPGHQPVEIGPPERPPDPPPPRKPGPGPAPRINEPRPLGPDPPPHRHDQVDGSPRPVELPPAV